MTSKELSALQKLNKEIDMLQGQLEKLYNACKKYPVKDIVRGSENCFPYVEHPMVICGIPDRAFINEKYEDEIARIIGLIEDRTDKSVKERERLQLYINSIDDYDVRRIFTLKYVDGLSWREVPNAMGNTGDGSTERKKHNRYLQNSPNSSFLYVNL